MSKVRPLEDRVLVVVIQRQRVTSGGVILPDQAREESDRGLVLAVGPGVPTGRRLAAADWQSEQELRPVAVSVGEVIVFSKYAGTKVAVDRDDFLLLRSHDILGVLDGYDVSPEEDEEGNYRALLADYSGTAVA